LALITTYKQENLVYIDESGIDSYLCTTHWDIDLEVNKYGVKYQVRGMLEKALLRAKMAVG
jgi:hypothetical protein